jgi:ABC-type glycerol-3-phosphate transport system permease component
MAGYFKTIPGYLEECARIDGATRFTAMWCIAFPLAIPGIPSAGIFAFHAELESVHLRAHVLSPRAARGRFRWVY